MKAFNPQSGDSGGDNRMDRFEALLRQDVGEPRFDWASLEAKLFARLQACDKLGSLADLKADAPSEMGMFERIESTLLSRIAAYKEYDQPIDDVIAAPAPSLEGQWQRMENRLEDRILSLQGSAPWEMQIKASEHPAPALYEAIEDKLDHHLAAAPQEAWEKLLKSDEPTLTQGRLENAEHALFARIASTEKQGQLANAGLALSFGFWSRQKAAKIFSMVLLTMASAFFGYRFFEENATPMATVVYQTQGSLAPESGNLSVGSPISAKQSPLLASSQDGAVTVVNGRGYVELRNGAAVRLEKASRREVKYRLVARQGRVSAGKATFFVTKRQKSERFEVATSDYRIEVLGTYFQVNPDAEGRVATTVYEGKVHIVSPEIGDLYLSEGQSLVFDATTGRYRVQNGGQVVSRETIESLPAMQDLSRFEVLSVTSALSQVEVFIDGHYRGMTPLAILQSPGMHALRLSKPGFLQVDTVVTLHKGLSNQVIAQLRPEPIPVASAATAPIVRERRVTIASERAPEPVAIAPQSKADLETLFLQAEAVQEDNWALATKLYEQVVAQGNPGMRHEAALFAIARLRTDHSRNSGDRDEARQKFQDYLARYPHGTFTGESWLRLAELELEQNPDKAISYYLKVFEQYPKHHRLAELQHRVGLIYLQKKNYDQAISMFRQGLANVLLDNDAEKRKLMQSLYRAFLSKGDLKSAQKIDSELVQTR